MAYLWTSVTRLICLVTALLFAISPPRPAAAQNYPDRPVKIVVAFNPGGTNDAIARITAEFLQRRLGQSVVVENRPGAATVIAQEYTFKSAPDGYTFMIISSDLSIQPAVRKTLPYDVEKFTFLMRPFFTNNYVEVGPNSRFTSMKMLIDELKANPGKVRCGIPGVGTFDHIRLALFESAIGGKCATVVYTGAGPLQIDLLAGTIDFYFTGGAPVPAGLRVIGGSSNTTRMPEYPELPTMEELGYKNAIVRPWFAFIAPPGLPKPIADRLIAELGAVYKDPEAIAKFEAIKLTPLKNPDIGEDLKKSALEEMNLFKEIVVREKLELQ